MGDRRDVYRVLVGKSEGRRPLGRPRHGWEDYYLNASSRHGMGSMGWIHLAQDRDRWWALVNVVMNLRFHKIWEISSLVEDMLASQEGLYSM